MSRLTVANLEAPAASNGIILMPPGHVIAAPGSIIQTVYKRVDAKLSYSLPINVNTSLAALDIVITPKLANSKILLMYSVAYETHFNTVFRISRGGSVVGINNTDSGRWSGIASPPYETDNNSTLQHLSTFFMDSPGSVAAQTYSLIALPSDGVAQVIWINRTFGSAGADAYEVGISQVMAQEIAQ